MVTFKAFIDFQFTWVYLFKNVYYQTLVFGLKKVPFGLILVKNDGVNFSFLFLQYRATQIMSQQTHNVIFGTMTPAL